MEASRTPRKWEVGMGPPPSGGLGKRQCPSQKIVLIFWVAKCVFRCIFWPFWVLNCFCAVVHLEYTPSLACPVWHSSPHVLGERYELPPVGSEMEP